MKRLLIFDIDGTLLNAKHDVSCFVQAFEDTLGLKGFPVGMKFYNHTTDAGIAGEIIETAYGRPATTLELQAIQERYSLLLEEHFHSDSSSVYQVPGAQQALTLLRSDSRNQLALATGAWASAATIKLRLANLDVRDLPRATSDDAPSRVDIVRTIIERAKQIYACEAYDVIALVGDGRWDFDTACALGIDFVGIGADLHSTGTRWVFDDLQQITGLVSAFDSFSNTSTERTE